MLQVEDARKDVFVSLVTVLGTQNSADVADVIRDGVAMLNESYTNFEFVVVDNGASEAIMKGLHPLLRELPCVRIIRLSRQTDFDTAVFSGLEMAIGDYVAVFEAEYDPLWEVPTLIEQLFEGKDIVQGVSDRIEDSAARRFFRKLFFKVSFATIALDVPADATYFTSFTRRSLNAMVSSPAGLKYLRHLLRHVGFQVEEFRYERTSTKTGRRRPGFFDGIEVLTNYSIRPLRLVAGIGLTAALANLCYAFYVLFVFLSFQVERGWTTTNLQLSMMFFVLFLSLAVISEYIGRILSETRRGPSYFVMEEIVSSQLLADESRRNIA